MRLIALLSQFCSLLAAQPAGVMPDWEVRAAAAGIEKHTRTVAELLTHLQPEDWVANGAPVAYLEQLKQARLLNGYLAQEAQALARQPEKLSVALDTFLRLDHLQSLLDSLSAGAREYQDSSLGDNLLRATSQNSTTRERLKEYIRQLAGEREQEWEIANREAQRCRENLSKTPAAAPATKPK